MSTLASRSRSLLVAAAAAGGAACAEAPPGLAARTATTVRPAEERFRAVLSPREAVPAATSEAAGEASLTIVGGHLIVIDLSASGLAGATDAQAHVGRRGEVGPALADVFRTLPGHSARPGTDVPIVVMTMERSQMPSPQLFDELVRNVRAGTAYLNVRTLRFPSGEIRGQFAPAATQ
jgi:hypothetical protein